MNTSLSYARDIGEMMPSGIEILERMVNMESPSFDKELVTRLARFVGERFEEIGGQVEYLPAGRFGDHLRARFAGASDETVLLLGHTDTVFPAGEARKRPFRIEDGLAKGPGVFDMKAGILLMWLAMKALSHRRELARSVTILLTSDEEAGSPTSRGLIESEAAQARAVLVLEPSLPGGALKTIRKGIGRFTVRAIGRAAHAGINPEQGVNAIEEIAYQTLALQHMNGRGGSAVTVGVIAGGTRPNVVPAEAEIEVDVRISSAAEAAEITAAIRSLQPHLAGAHLEIAGEINRPPMERTAGTARLFETARAIAGEMGIDLAEGSTGGASDGNFTCAMGVPTLDGLGAIGHGAHSAGEFVDIASLPMRAALVAGLIGRV